MAENTAASVTANRHRYRGCPPQVWLYGMVMLWEYFALIFVRARSSVVFFSRTAALSFLAFHVYFYHFQMGFFALAAWTAFLVMFSVKLYVLQAIELPAYTSGDISHEQPRAHYVELPCELSRREEGGGKGEDVGGVCAVLVLSLREGGESVARENRRSLYFAAHFAALCAFFISFPPCVQARGNVSRLFFLSPSPCLFCFLIAPACAGRRSSFICPTPLNRLGHAVWDKLLEF